MGKAGEGVKAAEAALAVVTKAEAAALAAVTKEQAAIAELTAKAVLQLVRLAGFARDRAREKRSSDPRAADDHRVLFARLQLAAAGCVQNDELGEGGVQKLFVSHDGRQALEHAIQIEAKELLAQPAVQGYMKLVWQGTRVEQIDRGWQWARVFVLLLLQLLFLLPLVALVPALGPWLNDKLDFGGGSLYLLGLPVIKFGLECAADLALALALTLIPAADLATAPFAPLLLGWIGSGLLREGRQLMAFSSDEPTQLAPSSRGGWFYLLCRAASAASQQRLARVYDRLVAYWADHINRVDAMALIFSFAALVAFVSAGDSEDATATSLRVVAVFLLWLRVIRVLLVSPQFGPFVLMFFRMLCNDVIYFLVLLLFLLVAFAASWTVLLEPPPRLVEQQFGDEQTWRWTLSPVAHLKNAGCADELGGVDILSTLLRLLEGALTGNDQFECARESTTSPLAQWAFSFMYVMLTTVLLLNMLIAMCAAA